MTCGQVDQIARIEHFAIGGCTIFALAVSVVPSFTTPRLYGSDSVIWAVMVFNFVAYVFTGHTMNAISRSVTASSSCGATSSHSISTRPTSYLPDGKLPNYYDNPHVRPRADSTPAMYDRPSQLAVPQPTHNHNRLSSASTLINVPTVQCQEYRAPCDLKRSPTASGSGSSSTRNPRSSILRRMRFYVVAFLLIWLPGSVNRVYGQVSGGGKYTFALSVAQVVMQPSRGMANLVAYLLNLWYAGSFWRSMARVFGRRGGVEM
ncbi:hypothetical protein HK101_011099 [Irineochytrium annulatum]|nr:hypothetical protein HK101_011099 [Irineochytrium annulatum]